MRTFGLVLAAVGVGWAALPAGAKEIRKDYHETFQVHEGSTLQLRHGDGNVDLSVWDQDVVDVTVVYHGRFTLVGAGKEPDFSVEFAQKGDVIEVTGREAGAAMVGIYLSIDLDEYRYTIRAPAYLILDTRGDDGDVRVAGLEGEVRCRLQDGDVHLTDLASPRVQVELEDGSLRAERLAGAVDVTSDDGDVHLTDVKASEGKVAVVDGDVLMERCSGPWSVRTDDGSAELRAHRCGTLQVRSMDGAVRVELVAGDAADVDVEADDGSVEVEVGEGISAAFLLTADDGRIEIDAPKARRVEQDHGRAYGELGDAQGEMRIRTTDGSITLRASGGGA